MTASETRHRHSVSRQLPLWGLRSGWLAVCAAVLLATVPPLQAVSAEKTEPAPATANAAVAETETTASSARQPVRRTIARCGKGWLEEIDGYPVLHLKGTHYEMGWQHGTLLREKVRSNTTHLLKKKGNVALAAAGPVKLKPMHILRLILAIQQPHVPQKYFDEMQGLADATGMDAEELRMLNFIPELFHCSGFALMNSATKDGALYHGRVLDYAINWGLQNHYVLIVAEPDGGIPFVNVSYAGFVGCVTGMNSEHVSIGEMGGRGLGHWDGMPMALLVREALESSTSLDEAIDVFRTTPRTCEYYYVLADGEEKRAVGMEASWNRFQIIPSGTHHARLPDPVADCALLSAGDRYKELVRRVKENHGQFTPELALRLMDPGVAMKSNLHNALFEPATTRLWISNATEDGQPAATQPYASFQLTELLAARPAADATVLDPPPVKAKTALKPATDAEPSVPAVKVEPAAVQPVE
ncbi:MAG: peptidase C45 [Planctomycetaceae bacterium]|nr:peptidase C45 [Planctomycetaceae bacterium]